jgi:universal stress protein A
MNILDFLTGEHDRLRRQLVVANHCLSEACAREKIEALAKEFKVIQGVEEKILFPAVREISRDHGSSVPHYGANHTDIWRHLNRLLGSLGTGEFTDIQKEFFELAATAEISMDEEERVLFPFIRGLADLRTLEELGRQAEQYCCQMEQDPGPSPLPMNTSKRILVPIDFSHASIEALDYAALLAGVSGAQLILLTVEDVGKYAGYPPIAYYPSPKDLEKELLNVFNDGMKKWPKHPLHAYDDGLKIIGKVGFVIDEILKTAGEHKADMIIMGTHGRRGISRALMGSVTEETIRRAVCPVLAVRTGMSPIHREEYANKESITA